MEEKRQQELEQFKNDIENLLDSLVPVTRTLDRLEIQVLDYDVRVLDRVHADKDERILDSSRFMSDDDFFRSK